MSIGYLRWILVIPAATAAYFAAALGMAVVFGFVSRDWDAEFSDYPDPAFKLLLLRSLVEPAVFVCAGAATAPTRRFPVALVLSVIMGAFIMFTLARTTRTDGFDWVNTLSTMIGFAALVGCCYHFYRREKPAHWQPPSVALQSPLTPGPRGDGLEKE